MASASASGSSSARDSSSAFSMARFRNPDVEIGDSKHVLWAYTTITQGGASAAAGGNKKWICRLCGKDYSSSYTRVLAHLLHIPGQGIKFCNKMNPSRIRELEAEVEQAQKSHTQVRPPLPPNSSSSGASPSQWSPLSSDGCSSAVFSFDKRKRGASGAIAEAFKNEARENLRSEIARMFYTGGLPFHLARNPYYRSSYANAANMPLDGFSPPGYNALRTTLLQRERANVERLIQPIKNSWKEKGISLVSDGWSDAQRRPLINFMAASDGGPVFLKAIDGSGEFKDKNFVAKLMMDTISEIGAANVVQVITDNAPVCKAAGMLVEGSYPHIFWTPCVVHTLNLALKNICSATPTARNQDGIIEYGWIKSISTDVMFVKNFIMNHSMRLHMFNSFVPLKLLAIAETRFASTIVMLRRFKLIKSGLKNLVISDEWDNYRMDDTDSARKVKNFILDDVWWDNLEYVLSFTRPIYDMLRLCDTDKPTLHLVYDMWDTMIAEVKQIIYRKEGLDISNHSSFFAAVLDVLIDRWTKSSTPLHCMAHSLCPRYYTEYWLSKGEGRLPPHRDEEISEERSKCLARYFPDMEEKNKVLHEYYRFSTSQPPFDSLECSENRWHLDPKVWWVNYGSPTPKLQQLALKLLGQPCSSSCCERNWSTYSFIHSLRRNKILPKRAEDLVYVHTNLRLLSRKTEAYAKGESNMWDIGGDEWDSLAGPGILEVASFS